MDRLLTTLKCVVVFFLITPNLHADLLSKAPPSFNWNQGRVVPIDMTAVDLSLTFDVSTQKAKGIATVEFETLADGFPMFDLVPNPTLVLFDNKAITADELALVNAPDRNANTRFRVLKKNLKAKTKHVLYIEYNLRSSDLTFENQAVRSGFFMSDLSAGTGREFFEQYGPANFEFDNVTYTFHVRVLGTDKEHEVFTNGEITELDRNEWRVEFPDYFTASSLYFHITGKGHFISQSFDYEGLEKTIPMTVYSSTTSLTSRGMSASKKVMKELEATYGPYTHDKVVVFVTPGGGGMEHCGATMTSLWALEHEFTHFWFARGVMPANGNSGWIDEAIASWRDDGYIRARSAPNRSPVNMSNFSPYKRDTSRLAYSRGAQLISEFDYMFADQGGMKPIIRELFTINQKQTITYQYFKKFLEDYTSVDLTDIFDRYVLGKNSNVTIPTLQPETLEAFKNQSKHPRPYTQAEIQKFR